MLRRPKGGRAAPFVAGVGSGICEADGRDCHFNRNACLGHPGPKWRCVGLTLGLIKIEERFYRGDSGEPKREHAKRVLPLGLLIEPYRAAGRPRDFAECNSSGSKTSWVLLRGFRVALLPEAEHHAASRRGRHHV